MNTDTLNTQDELRSRPDVAKCETDDLHNNPNHTLSQRRDEQISGDARPKVELERKNDAHYGVKLSGNGSWDAMEENGTTKETGPRSPLPNVGQGNNQALTPLTDAKSQSFTKPTLPPTSQGSISTIRPIKHTQNKKYASHIPARATALKTSTSASKNISHNRSGFLQSASRHGQTGPSSNSSVAQINSTSVLNTLKTIARIQEGTVLNAESRNLFGSEPDSSPTRTGNSVVASSPVRPRPDTASALPPTGGMSTAVSNTVLGPRPSGFFASDSSISSTHSQSTHSQVYTKNKTLQKSVRLVTQNFDHPISRQTPQHFVHSAPKAPSNPTSHSPISSPSCSNNNREAPLSALPSPTLPINFSLKDLCNHTSADGYTSADAEGESIAASDSIFEFIESSVVDIKPTHSIKASSTILQSLKQSSHKSTYDLVTPPLTRHTPQVPSLAEHETIFRREPRRRLFMSYVAVPLLPEGATKLKYRSFKRAKHTHDVEYFPESGSEDNWGRERCGRGIKGRARDTRRQSNPRTVRSSSLLSMARKTSSFVAHGQQAGQPETILSKPSIRSESKTSGKGSATQGRLNIIASTSTTYHSSSQSLPPEPTFQVPSPTELEIEHRVHDAEHLSPVVTYFNTRHCQFSSKEETTSWILLGAQILMKCPGSRKLSCVGEMNFDDNEETDQVDYKVGGPVSWECCSDDDEESLMTRLRKRRGKIDNRSRLEGCKLKSSVVKQRKPSQALSDTQSLATPVPKLDLKKALKEKTSTTPRTRNVNRDMKKGRANSPAETSDTTVPALSQPQPQPQPRSGAAVEQSAKSSSSSSRPYHLSEKARGKQKAFEYQVVEPDFHGDLHPVTAPSPTTTQGLLDDVSTVSPTANSPTWHRSIEEYITFDASPVKLGEGSKSGDAEYAPNFAYAPYDTHQFLSPRTNMDDLFLPPHDVEPSIFEAINLMEGIDAYHAPYGMSMNVEEDIQPITVNPTLLGGNNYDQVTDEVGLTFGVTNSMDGTDSTGIEDQRLQDAAMHGEQLLGMKTGYELISDSPIVSGARPSSGSSNMSSQLSQSPTPLHSRSISAKLLRKTSSPEFSDYNVPSRARLSSSPGTPHSIKSVRTEASFPRQNIFVSSEDEEEEVRRGLEYADTFSTSDEEFIPPSDLENESEDVNPPRPASLRSKRKFSVPSYPDSTPPTAVAKAFRRTRDWECGPIRSGCHYCRMSSNKLKMVCPCGLRYCNRCITLRFPDITFRSKWGSFECPSCKNQCTCDICTRKRGEVYVSRRRNKENSSQTAPAIIRPKRTVQRTVQPSSLPKVIPLPSPEAVETTESFSFWGSIYDMNGSKIAIGFADEDNEVVIASTIEGYTRSKVAESVLEDDMPAKRTFVGAYQPSWGLGSSPIIKELRGRVRPRRINDEDANDTNFRWYIGKENLLYRSVVARTRDLQTNLFSDMSSLTSISDDSDAEMDGNASVSVVDKTSTSFDNSLIDEKKRIKKVDPNAIQARDTVHILQTIAQDICGMTCNVEQSLMNT